MSGWLSVPQAAERLGVSARRVRQLLDAGDLAGDVVGRHVLVDAESVARRRSAGLGPGRPASARLAWAALAALSDREQQVRPRDPVLRHRLAKILAQSRGCEAWVNLLRRRATIHRYWAHPGVVEDLLTDPNVSVGRARAAALAGLRISPGDDAVAYVRADDLPAVEARYGLQPDAQGRIELRAVPPDAGEFSPTAGRPAPIAAAVLDMAESPDARMQALALEWLNTHTRPQGKKAEA